MVGRTFNPPGENVSVIIFRSAGPRGCPSRKKSSPGLISIQTQSVSSGVLENYARGWDLWYPGDNSVHWEEGTRLCFESSLSRRTGWEAFSRDGPCQGLGLGEGVQDMLEMCAITP